jgi:hypothetical protein
MLQRIQSLYLLFAITATVVCLCLPIGYIEPLGMGVGTDVFNLWVKGANGVNFSVWPLFAFLLLSCPIAIAAIFLFKKRKLQSQLCFWGLILNIAWYVYYAFCFFNEFQTLGSFHIKFAAGLPLIAIVFYALAHKGIMHDEKLIKSADRIR